MGLTLVKEQDLAAANLIDFFEETRAVWLDMARRAYDYTASGFHAEEVRRDDVAKSLFPFIEIDEALQMKLNEKRLRQKYWISYFTDLIIDRCWSEISTVQAPSQSQ